MGKILRKARERLASRRLAHAALIKALPTNVNRAAFKAPGSMRKHKGK